MYNVYYWNDSAVGSTVITSYSIHYTKLYEKTWAFIKEQVRFTVRQNVWANSQQLKDCNCTECEKFTFYSDFSKFIKLYQSVLKL